MRYESPEQLEGRRIELVRQWGELLRRFEELGGGEALGRVDPRERWRWRLELILMATEWTRWRVTEKVPKETTDSQSRWLIDYIDWAEGLVSWSLKEPSGAVVKGWQELVLRWDELLCRWTQQVGRDDPWPEFSSRWGAGFLIRWVQDWAVGVVGRGLSDGDKLWLGDFVDWVEGFHHWSQAFPSCGRGPSRELSAPN